MSRAGSYLSTLIKKKSRAFTVVCALVLVCAALAASAVISNNVLAADPPLSEQPAATVSISSSADLITYSREYARGGHNPNDTVQLALSSGTSFVLPSGDDGYIPIGNAGRPFNGKIEIADNAVSSIISDVPFFGHVTTDVTIANPSGTVRELQIARLDTADAPLFARNVVSGAVNTGSDWKICLKADERDPSNKTAYPFAGVVGDIAAGAKAGITFTHDSVSSAGTPANAQSAGDLGLICNTLGAGAELTANITSANVFDVVSIGGNSGGVVGTAANGAKIILANTYSSVANVTASGNGKYAGGIVGHATNAELQIEGSSPINITKTVNGKGGAGGVYGYYKSTTGNGTGENAAIRTFELNKIGSDSSFTLAGGTGAGVLAGVLDAENSVTVTETGVNLTDNNFTRQVRFTGGTNRGGIFGKYTNSALANTLYIHDCETKIVAYSGSASYGAGAIGAMGEDNPNYVKLSNYRLSNTGAQINAGLIGNMNSLGSFVDIENTVDIDGSVTAGLIDRQSAGVVRISGVTDLTDSQQGGAQIVRTRENGLIYALGSGNDADWTFKRGTGHVDDVGDWGEVLRLSTANGLGESDFFTVNMTNHTVAVAGYAASMGSLKDFVRTALNIQLNLADTGALSFDGSSRSGTVLADDLAFTADINLSGTGITGLARDNGGNADFTGTIAGNSHKVTLATGEPYGQRSGVGLSAPGNIGDNNYGTIIDHHYLGLLAEANGATIANLTVNGYISAAGSKASEYKAGGVVASVGGSGTPLTLTGVKTAESIYVYPSTNNSSFYCGGAVGYVAASTAGTIAASGCDFAAAINEKSTNNHTGSAGGAIGHVASTAVLTFDFDNDKISGSYDNTAAVGSTNFNTMRYGGLIGFITANSGSFSRNVTLNGVTVADTASINCRVNGGDRSASAGAFLGGEWYDTNVTIGTEGDTDGVTVGESGGSSDPSVNVSAVGSSKPIVSACVAKATGKWVVNNLTVNNAAINAANTSHFGFIVGDGIRHSDGAANSAIYLTLITDGYDIANTTFTGNYEIFDEVVGYSVAQNKNVEDNGQGIVSIRTAGGAALIMNGSACNTYQNVTSYGKNTRTVNPNTRYYYNLDAIWGKAVKTDAEKMLLLSVNKYAHVSIRNNGYFNNNFSNTISGNCDMAGLSYYPVDASGIRITDADIKFYNSEIETGENGTGNTDGSVRSTRANSPRTQHYMMHESVFRNYSGAMTVNGVSFAGNVSNQHGGSESGFLVCGTMGDTNETSRITISDVELKGAEIARSGSYAPLLINKIGKNVKFELSGLSALAGSGTDVYPSATTAVASSLIGDVGSDTAININLTFSDIRLDARTATGGLSGLTTAYGTSRSIFDRATLLNSFRFLNGSMGEYNYTHDEDWTSSQHHVTYGSEVTTSVEYAGREDHYYDDSTHYTHPTDSTGASAYDFSSGFLPYVYTASDPATYYHELKVNVKDVDLTSGCGQYNDPYIITDGAMIATAAKIISGNPDNGIEIKLPTDVGSEDMWCTNNETHAVFVYDSSSSSFKLKSDGSNPKTLETVRTYLAGAYYSITAAEITLPATFVGFGALTDWTSTNNYECKYAFRGVIIGNRNTIINQSTNPLVKTANGCVVKEITLNADSPIVISQASRQQFRYDNADCMAYGGVIGRVMGGDNIIDHVEVGFTDGSVTADSTTQKRLVCVGGYVGVIVNGGVVFRGMDSGVDASGLTSSACAYVEDEGWLYVNPIVGRVLAGYAFNEVSGAGSAYSAASLKMNNGSKGYGIPDLKSDASSKLTVNATSASNHTIEVPDAQALYILSCVVNTGAGSAAYNASTEQAYAAIANTPWIGYRDYTCTRCGAYNDTGASASPSGDYATVNAQDKYAGSNKIPYIVRQYTVSTSGSLFRARSICGNSVVASITFAGGTYDLPGGYRGIGNIYVVNNAFRLRFTKIVGNDSVIDLDMDYREYTHESGNQSTKSNNTIDNYIPASGGFGLFNNMYHNNASATNSIEDLTLTGSVFYDLRKLTDGSTILYTWGWHNYNNLTGYYPNVADRIEAATILSTGGLAGKVENNTVLNNVCMDTLTVEGAKYTGGLFGYSSGKTITVNSPQADGLTVKGGHTAGGVIGYFNGNGSLTVKGTESEHAVFDLTDVQVKGYPTCAKHGADKDDFSNAFHCAGGICGFLKTGISGTTYKADIQYVDVTGTLSAPHKDKRPNDMRYKICTGGLFGKVDTSKIIADNCVIENATVEGNLCGGMIGHLRYGLEGDFTNITVNDVDFNSYNSAGGFIGYYYQQSGVVKVKVDNYNISGCNMFSLTSNVERACAGGFFGHVYFNAWTNNTYYFDIANSSIKNSTVKRENTSNTENIQLCGVGGIYGAIGTATGFETGHNILMDGVTVVNTGNRIPGSICGTSTSAANIKLTGVCLNGGNSTAINTVGVAAANIYGSSGFVIMADYDAVSAGLSANDQNGTLYNSTNDYAATAPYVHVNPIGNVGSSGLQLTSHGVAATVTDLPIQEIMAGDKRYPKAAGYVSQFNTAKLSTYNLEQGRSLTDDFALLIVDDVSRIETTKLINAYINMLSNTAYNYGANTSGVYRVDVYKMEFDEGQGKFVKSNTAANLKRGSNQFYMNIDSVDSAGNMFSLIDVSYFDPINTSKVAYHLYIPVLVKKMLTYDFTIATGTGTNYERAWYSDRFGQPLMENLGTPASIYFKWDYLRSRQEWQEAANNGDNLLRNYAKTLTLSKSAGIPDLPGTTVLVLNDATKGGKPYYARFSDVYSAGVLSLSGFRETLGDNTSAAFTPTVFNDFLDLTAAASEEGTMVACAEGAASVRAKLGGTDTFFRIATEDDSALQHYTITVNNTDNASGCVDMEEPYYISFFTQSTSSNTVYHYTISAPPSFNDPANPSRIEDADKLQNREGTVHMILGNIFVQTGLSLTTAPANTEISILTSNHVVTVNTSATVSLANELKSEVQGYLGAGSGINVFHSFVLRLTRSDEMGNRKVIAGSPTVGGTYTISSVNGNVSATDPTDKLITINNSYMEVQSANVNQNLNDFLVNGNGATITAQVTLDYPTDAAVVAQFPSREDVTNTSIGTTVSGSSNIAYDRAGTSYSKVAQDIADSTGHSYYCLIDDKKAKLYYNVKSDIFVGDYGPLGINPLDASDINEMQISAVATYDISDIEPKTVGYDMVKITLRLYSKTDGYAVSLPLSTYMNSVGIRGFSAGDTGYSENRVNPNEYVFTMPRSVIESRSALATRLEIPVDYKVITGAAFESAGLFYSNYKLYAVAELVKSTNLSDTLPISIADDFLIYTNARIYPDYIE